MSPEVTVIVLLAAAFHASWNALIKVRGDRLIVMAIVTLTGSAFSVLFAPFVDAPDPSSWPFLALSILLHTAYHLFLPFAYDHGDLGKVYPIARGSAPLLVALGAWLVVGERLSPLTLLGILCLAAGVMALAFDRRAGAVNQSKAVIFALLTGLLIASYTIVDGVGARQAGAVLGFAVWLTIGDGLLTFFVVYIWKGRKKFVMVKQHLGVGFLGGILQVVAYWIIVWALAVAPMAMVSSLRETSVLFAALISTFVLKEGFGVWRFVSAGLIALGLVATKASK